MHLLALRACLKKSLIFLAILTGCFLTLGAWQPAQAATLTKDLDWNTGSIQDLEGYSKANELRLAPTGTWGAQSWRTPDKVLNIGSAFASDGTDVYVLRGNADVAFWRYKTQTDTWEQLANAPRGAYYGADLIYLNGYIYAFFGGYQKSFARYSITNNSWELRSEFPSIIYRGGSVTTDGTYIYGVTGNNTQEFYRYNLNTDAWSPLAPTPAALSQGADLVFVDGAIYTPRGANSTTFYKYTIATGAWSTQSNLLVALNGDVDITTDGEDIYAARQTNTTTFWKYDVGANTWSTLANAPYAAQNGGVQFVGGDGLIYFFRGNSDYRFWKYNPNTNTFLGPNDAPAGLGVGSDLVYYGGDIYVVRGNNGNVLYRYGPSTNTWTTMATAPGNFNNDTKGVAAGSELYFFMGNTNNTFWRYTPGSNTWTTMANAPNTVRFGGALVYPGTGNYLYATRGNNTTDFWRYNIGTNAWEAMASLPAGILANYGSRLVSDGTYIYYTGGQGQKVFYRYSIGGNTWSEMAAPPFSPYLGTDMVYRGGKIIALAGWYRPEMYEYIISTNTWRELASFAPYGPTEIGAYSGASIELDAANDVLYVTVGGNRTEMLAYNPGTYQYEATGVWQSDTLDFQHVSSWSAFNATQETPGDSSIVYQTRSSANGTDWSSWQNVSGGVIASAANRYLQVKATLYAATGQTGTPVLQSASVVANGDATAPTNPASVTGLSQVVGGQALVSGNSYKFTHPYFSWTAGTDSQTAIDGYYVYFGTNELVNPADGGAGSTYQAATTYQVNTPFTTGTYYLRIATKDTAGNVSTPFTAFVYTYNGISPSSSVTVTSTGEFSGTATDVTVAGDKITLTAKSGGFWLEERLTPPPAAIQWGGVNAVYDETSNKLYLLQASNSTVFYAYGLSTDTWETLAAAPATVNYGGGLVAGPDGYLYASRGGGTTDFWRYSIADNTWDTAVTGAPLTISYGSSMVYDGSQYLYISRGGGTDTFWRYDTGTDEWFSLSGVNFGAPSSNINNFINRGADLAYDAANGLIYATQGNYLRGFSVYNTNTGAWTQLTDAPSLPYDGSAMEYDPDKNVVYYTAGNTTDYFYQYDVENQEWQQLAAAPTTLVYGAGLTKVGNVLYVIRGGASTGFYKYNIAKNSWLIPTRGLFNRVFDGASLLGVVGGAEVLKGDGDNFYVTRGNYSDDFVRWNQTTGQATRLANLPVGSTTGGAMVYDSEDNTIYLSGGTFETSFYMYSIATNSWSRISTDPLPAALGVGSAMVFDGSRYIYAIRGGNTNTFYRYDKDASAGARWATRANATATLNVGSELVLKSGYIYTPRGNSNTFYRYDINANTWSTLANIPANMGGDGWFVDGNDGYFYAARGANTAEFYRYSVGDNTWSTVTSAPAQFTTGAQGESNGSTKIFALAGAGTNTYSDGLYTYVLQTADSGFLEEGEYISQVHDLGSVYKWANLTVGQVTAANSDLQFATRSSADNSVWSNWTDVSHKRQIGDTTVYKINSPVNKYLQLRVTFTSADGVRSAALENYTINYYSDVTPPTNPQTAGLTAFSQASGGTPLVTETWYGHATPHFVWADAEATNGGSDTAVGSGISGYYVYFGTDPDADPVVSGQLQAESTFTASGLTTGTTNYLRVKAVDAAGNVAASTWAAFIYKFDSSQPNPPATLVADPAGYSATNSFDFTWTAASVSGSPVVAWCYKTGATEGEFATEQCTDTTEQLSIEEIPAYKVGVNVFQVRAKNQANTFSQPKTVNYYYANPENAPSPPTNLHLTTPESNTVNSFGFAWDVPSAFLGSASNLSYRFSVNVVPTPQSTTATSLKNLNAGAYATLPGENVFYVVAQDEAGNINYSNYASVSFYANTVAPGIPTDVEIADVSVKSTSAWRLALSWDAPTASGSGVYNYAVYRSTDAENYAKVSTTSSNSFVDTNLTQVTYYYKIKACDNTSNCGEFSSQVSLLPDGRFTDAPSLTADPTVSQITTRKAVVSWSTNRTSDSKIAYGTKSGEYFEEEVGSSQPVTSHQLTLNNLTPGTKYYFTAKWTDEDGNTGNADELTFTTQPPPSTEEPMARNVGLTSAVIEFVVRNAARVKLYYGETPAFGGVKEIVTSTAESTQVVELNELKDATKYYYKINTLDTDGTEYEGEMHSFETLPRPTISNVIVQQINGTAKTTLLVRWASNTPISSIVTYYPTGAPQLAKDEVNVALEAGAHQMILFNLEPQTPYSLVIRGQDVAGNEAASDVQQITTSADTRPPQITELKAESEIIGTGEEATAQLIVSYKTDEPATSQVEYGEGAGSMYSQKSQRSTTPTDNHLVIISGLTPGRVYHLRSISVDAAGNEALSVDKVVVTQKATADALDLVVNNLVGIFSFLK